MKFFVLLGHEEKTIPKKKTTETMNKSFRKIFNFVFVSEMPKIYGPLEKLNFAMCKSLFCVA